MALSKYLMLLFIFSFTNVLFSQNIYHDFSFQKNFDILGYILILVPIIIVFIGYSLGIQKQEIIVVSETPKTTEKFTTKVKVPERIEAKMT